MPWKVEGISQTGHPKKTWWGFVKDAQSRKKWRRIKDATA